jgi:hypothetical protein
LERVEVPMRMLTLALVLAAAGPALAKDRPPQPVAKHIDDFDDEVVEAPLHAPWGDDVNAQRQARHPSLIRMREDFRPEMLRSMDTL